MHTSLRFTFLTAVVILALAILAGSASADGRHVDVLTMKGVINPVMAGYIERGITKAENDGASAVVIQMDTPGGLSDSMDAIIQKIVASRVPVIVYVSPQGGRAASAGVYITYAAQIAAMAPSTNIGSAHPVQVDTSGQVQQGSDTMTEKITNDAVAKIKTLAVRRGRNADWAEQAVRNSVNVTENEALNLGVIDLVAPNLQSLLDQIDGRQVEVSTGMTVLQTRGASINYVGMGPLDSFLHVISDPNIAYILLSIGMLAIFFELSSPGAILPGVIGGIFLLLAFFALGTLPVNFAGLALIILSFLLFAVDLFAPTHGALTVGGVVAFTLGSIMLINAGGESFMRVSLPVIATMVICITAFFTFAIGSVVKSRFRRVVTGKEGMIGSVGVARTALKPEGQVFVEGELWKARSDDGVIEEGENVVVTRVDHLELTVRRVKTTLGSAPWTDGSGRQPAT